MRAKLFTIAVATCIVGLYFAAAEPDAGEHAARRAACAGSSETLGRGREAGWLSEIKTGGLLKPTSTVVVNPGVWAMLAMLDVGMAEIIADAIRCEAGHHRGEVRVVAPDGRLLYKQ
jgi:hypothetical protein